MVSDAERMARAGEYVLGRMNADERERAERDLELDAAFRLAVMEVAERMRHAYPPAGGESGPADAAWAGLAQRLAALPHMQGADLPTGAARFEAPPPATAPGRRNLRDALHRWTTGLRRTFRHGAPEGVAILHTSTREPAAVVELRRGNRLRLLLIHEFPLRAGERLSLWSHAGDGVYARVAGFTPQSEIGLWSTGARAGFALARERLSPAPPDRMSLPPLAEGLPQPLAASGDTFRDESDLAPPLPGRRGIPG